ncbi:MAG: Gfo/Idh/MocA family oxidoreductase, partial [Planctomycetaceae bacterium]|nr:Gfo/Idh/MocA family oxidoreductase [Planctomycetaceae bacterium]
MKRRDFLGYSAIAAGAAAAVALSPWETAAQTAPAGAKVRVAVIGTGGRGTALLRILLAFPEVEVVAVCDTVKANAERAAKLCADAGKPAPAVYADDEKAWKQLLEKEKIDLAVIAAGWHNHAEISHAA